MRKAIIKIWRSLSHMDTAISMLEWGHWLSAAGISGLAILTAWWRETDPIILFVIGLAAFALVVFIFERFSAWRCHKQKSQRETEKIAESAEQTEPGYDTPIYRAVDHVASRIDDCNSNDCYPAARRALRKAASKSNIKMHGKKELKDGYPSDLRTLIPEEFWNDQELSPLATSEAYIHHEHTQAEMAPGFITIGERKERYWDIRVSMNEIKKKWP